MRFKLDENIDLRAAAVLAGPGHDVTTVAGQDLGEALDRIVAEVALAEERVLVTLDRGFAPGERSERVVRCHHAGPCLA